ncbi:glycosyltransferase family 4 protein [Gluconobacter morbifer]|uniref:Putative hexosyltransferase n=1 Tax=Gluconobacter morbifer G707 TaxID=1088869 RepID=G6XFP5_9PROT|nr:glycosyltransferase family 4 protein [Gluconobacter morbifer]EHH69003.1 putative hexosyltransferase [Gluconobacter morbifer G707]
MSTVLTVLPPREQYTDTHAGAISLLVSRLAQPGDIICGTGTRDAGTQGASLPGGVFHRLRLTRWPFPRMFRYGLACLEAIRQYQPSLVEVHNRPDLAQFLSRFAPVRLIFHNDPRGMKGARTPARRADLARRVLVCAVSRWLAERFTEGSQDIRVEIQPNCLDLMQLPAPRERRPSVLFAGRVVSDKGADAFVRAWGAVRGHFPGWDAVIMGADRFGADSPETPFLSELRPQAAAQGVRMTGYQPHEAVLDAMTSSSIVVVPSRWPEPFGMTALEAMGCGAAVIASPVGALPDVVGDAAVLAVPDEPGALEDALSCLMADAELRVGLGQKARRRAAQFGMEAARARLLDLRRAAVDARGR